MVPTDRIDPKKMPMKLAASVCFAKKSFFVAYSVLWLKSVKGLVFLAWGMFHRILCFYEPKVVEGFCENRAPPLDPLTQWISIQVARLPQRKAWDPPRGQASVPGGHSTRFPTSRCIPIENLGIFFSDMATC